MSEDEVSGGFRSTLHWTSTGYAAHAAARREVTR